MKRPSDSVEPSPVPELLLYRIHATIGKSAEWSAALAQLGHWLGGRCVTLATHHFSRGKGEVLCQAPSDPAFSAAYADYASRNPWFMASAEYLPGKIIAGEDLLSNRDLVKTDFYRHLLKPRGLLHRLCGVAARCGQLVYYVDIHRGEDQEGFCDRDKTRFKAVLAHLALALSNGWAHREASDLAAAMRRVVERHSHATFLCDTTGRVIYRNGTAAELLAQNGGLRVDGECIAAVTAADTRALRDAIAEVARAAAREGTEASRVMTLSAPGAEHPALISLYPAGRIFLGDVGEVIQSVILTARNPHLKHSHHDCSFALRFDLSPAQARVSGLIFTGVSLTNVARLLHLSENTVRSHLKQIFQKTNTHGQMELVHLHSRICIDKD